MAELDLAEFHDPEGESIWLSGEVSAIYTRHPEKTLVASFPGRALVAQSEEKPVRVIVTESGHWGVTESYEEILAKLATKKED